MGFLVLQENLHFIFQYFYRYYSALTDREQRFHPQLPIPYSGKH